MSATPTLLPVFNALPGANLLLAPDLHIVAASDDYLAATLTQRTTIVGQFIFDAFPENSQTSEANGVANVRASLEQVLATKQPHTMAPQHYDVPDRTRPGQFVKRHWLPRHTPVLDAAGQVQFIIQSVQDVTASRLVERQLSESRAAEQAARAETEAQRQRFYEVLMQLPAQIATYHGPDHVYVFVNPRYQRYFPSHNLLGRSIREALPEVGEQGIFALLDRVYQTGESFFNPEVEAWVDFTGTGRPEQVFLNLLFHALRDAQGNIDGVLDFSYDVTEQVRARQQVEQLNQELEARVQARTQQVHEQGQRLERLFMQAPAAICILSGPELMFELVNPIYQQFFSERRLLGKPLLEALPELADHAVYHTMRHVFETGQTSWQQALHVPLARTDNGVLEDRYFNYVQQPRYDEQDRIDGVLVFGFEVTELVQARQQAEALQAQVLAVVQRQADARALLYQVFEQTPAAICIQRGPEHRYEYVNAAYQAFFPSRELLGRTVAEALPETVEAGVVALLDHVYQTGETYFGHELPLLIAQPEGPPKQMYFTFTYQAYRENGDIVGISTFAYDVAEQVLARQDREAQQRKFYTLFEQAPIGICIQAGPDWTYEFINDSYQRLLPGRVLRGRPLLEAMPELVGTDVERMLRRVYETGETQQELALLIPVARVDENGQLGELENRYFTVVYQARRDEQGLINGILNFVVEVTEQVQASQQVQDLNQELAVMNQELAAINEEMQATNEELNESNARLTRTNVDLDNFIYTASHDLKAPISNIEGLLHALLDHLSAVGGTDEMTQPILEMMQGAVDRFKQTIDQLTDISKLQQEHTQRTEPVDLAAVVEDVRLDLLPLLAETDAHLDVAVTECPAIAFSAKNLRSVIYNLLSNALKYRHPDRAPHIRIHCQHEAGGLVLRVQDNGLGLSETQQAKLFGMFRRLHTHVEGSGIGLYMVKKMMENAGGKIKVESQVDVGSTFTVYFPV